MAKLDGHLVGIMPYLNEGLDAQIMVDMIKDPKGGGPIHGLLFWQRENEDSPLEVLKSNLTVKTLTKQFWGSENTVDYAKLFIETVMKILDKSYNYSIIHTRRGPISLGFTIFPIKLSRDEFNAFQSIGHNLLDCYKTFQPNRFYRSISVADTNIQNYKFEYGCDYLINSVLRAEGYLGAFIDRTFDPVKVSSEPMLDTLEPPTFETFENSGLVTYK